MTTDVDAKLFDRFQLIVNGPALFQALMTGIDLGVFDELSRRPGQSLDELAALTGLERLRLRALMLALCSTELVTRDRGLYTNSSLAERFLVGTADDGWAHILRAWEKIYYPAFPNLTEALSTGRNVGLDRIPGTGSTLYERLAGHPDLEGILHRSMSAFTLRSMSGLIDHCDLGGRRRLLDVGGGDGTTALALVAANPDLRVTLFDAPTVAGRMRPDAPEDHLARIDVVAGDIFADPFPSGCDVLLFSHLLEIFDEDQIRVLARKAFDALPVGGKVMIYGFLSTGDETAGVFGARLALYLNVLASGRGMAFPAGDYEAALSDVGFQEVRTVPDLPYEHGLVIGTRL